MSEVVVAGQTLRRKSVGDEGVRLRIFTGRVELRIGRQSRCTANQSLADRYSSGGRERRKGGFGLSCDWDSGRREELREVVVKMTKFTVSESRKDDASDARDKIAKRYVGSNFYLPAMATELPGRAIYLHVIP